MEYNFFDGTVPRSGIKVYHLYGEVSTDELGMVTDEEFHFSDVFSSLKKAESAGRKLLKEKLRLMYKRYYKESRYDNFKGFYEQVTSTVGIIDSEREVCGGFTIMEFDPLFHENYDDYEKEYAAMKSPKGKELPQEIEYRYNLLGNLELRIVEPYGVCHFPEDNLPESGLKFKHGDFVTSSADNHKQVYIVSGALSEDFVSRAKKNLFWENMVELDYIDEHKNWYVWDLITYPEALLRRYDGEVSEPMMIISKILKGEIDISKKLWREIENNEVSFSSLPRLKEAIANDKINSPEESINYKGDTYEI